MFNICICDDNTDFLLKLSNKINEISCKNNLDVNIIKYSSSQNLIFNMDNEINSIDIYFLDVLIDNLTGIDLANTIRKYNLTSQIIFLTSSKDHVFDALDTMPLHYLIKQNLDTKKFEEVFMRAISLIKPRKDNLFHYKIGHSIECIDKNKILFFEIKNRIVTMKCIDGTSINFYFTMKKLIKQINDDNFVQIHRSFLINTNYIKSINGKNIICNDNTILPIGEKYIKSLKSKYSKFLLNSFIDS